MMKFAVEAFFTVCFLCCKGVLCFFVLVDRIIVKAYGIIQFFSYIKRKIVVNAKGIIVVNS